MKPLISIFILMVMGASLYGASPLAKSIEPRKQPNVIYILADDLGYGDLGCYGQTQLVSHNIDALAEQGMRFTQHYSGSTVCAPSRCSLLTGMHTGHAVVRGNAEYKPEGQEPMPSATYTVADLMKQAGYRTGAFGKWGLGYPGSSSDPLKMGFDRFYGYNCQRLAHSYYPAFLWNDDQREFLWGNVGSFDRDYAPGFVHAEALEFIRSNKDQPFFMYYAAIQPHADMIAPEAYMEKYRGKFLPENEYDEGYYIDQPEGHAAFAAMVEILDNYVGEIVAELESQGIAENTLIIFTSDNGPHLEGGHDPDYWNSNGGLRGHKRDLYEGGIRVPFIAKWPGNIEAGSKNDHISAFWDFLPTMAELIGVNLNQNQQIDGVSMLPTLLGKSEQLEHEYLYWEFHAKKGRVAIRKGKWKGIRYDVEVDAESPLELYDLSVDPAESHNIADKHPEIIEALEGLLKTVRSRPVNPRFLIKGLDLE